VRLLKEAAIRSEAMQRLDVLVAAWRTTMRNAWFLEPPGFEVSRQDPDMFQRFVADVGPDRIVGRWEASEDQGSTWRKDFDLVFERT
jgi:hypothetical protein